MNPFSRNPQSTPDISQHIRSKYTVHCIIFVVKDKLGPAHNQAFLFKQLVPINTLLILIVIMTVVKITHFVMQPSVFKTAVDTFPDRSFLSR